MSTLLKKKYMRDLRRRLKLEADSDTTAGAVSSASGITDESHLTAVAQVIVGAVKDGSVASPTTTAAACPPKAVSFKDLVSSSSSERLDLDTLQRYRNDIWYTVRSSVSSLSSCVCPGSWSVTCGFGVKSLRLIETAVTMPGSYTRLCT
jgi:hypothetical protein